MARFGRQAAGLVGWLVLASSAGACGSLASAGSGEFYRSLERPPWGARTVGVRPAWTLLYVLMAAAARLVWRMRGFAGARATLDLFVVQLALNALWTRLLLGWRVGAAAFAGILVLWALIAATTVLFWRIRAVAGMLMLPYLLWVGFAAALTWAVWKANPMAPG